jgi:streptogramin lyase
LESNLKRSLVFAGAVAAALLLGGCGKTAPVTSGTAMPGPPFTPLVSTEYPIPTAASKPGGIAKTATSLWFTEEAADKIGILNLNATVTDFPVPTANAQPLSIVLGQDGNLWFTEFGAAKIGTVSQAGVSFIECVLPPQNASTPTPFGITAGPDGNLWVTDPGSNGIWRVTTGCSATFFSLTTPMAGPQSITTGPNGAIWFLETAANKVAEIFPNATAGTQPAEFPVSAGAGLGVIVAGADNAMWFTETASIKLGRMLTTGQLAAETPLTGLKQPYGLVQGPDGNFYIGDQAGSTISQYAPTTGAIRTFPTKTANAGVFALTVGPDNEIYFTEQTANNLAQFRYF